jgi:hypothetical protein
MNKLITFIIATLALATSAMAKIGETPQRVLDRSYRDKDIIHIEQTRVGQKYALNMQYADGAVVTHVFGVNGRELAMLSYAPKGFKPEDVVAIQKLYPGSWHGTGTTDGLYSWASSLGLSMTAKRYNGYDELTIVDANRAQEVGEFVKAIFAQEAAPTPPPAPTPDTQQNDCLPFATEAYARLKHTATWVKIAGFNWIQNGAKIGGHAVVIFQPEQNSDLWMYDRSGSHDLGIQSHEPRDIQAALNQWVGQYGLGVESFGWIGG